jgi:hypothetical protein
VQLDDFWIIISTGINIGESYTNYIKEFMWVAKVIEPLALTYWDQYYKVKGVANLAKVGAPRAAMTCNGF